MSSAHAAQSSIKLRLLPANDQDHSLSSFRSEKDPVRYPGEFKAWVKSWVALSRLWHERDVGQANASHYRAGKRSTARNGNHMPSAALVHLPPEILNLIMAYLRPQDLANLLQTPSSRLYHVAKSAIARRRHEITSLANLHAFLAYGGKMPLFYRTATMLLFGRHFVRLVPEAKSLLGLGYAIVLAWFMVLFYTVPFLIVIAIYFILDITTLMTRTTASLLLHRSPLVTTHHFPSFFKTPPVPSYTYTVRDLCFTGTPDPHTPTRGLLNPWASHLYLLSSCCPNLRRLHLVGCSLAWWFRLAKLGRLEELVLEGCELDETGLDIVAESCGKSVKSITVLGGDFRGSDSAEDAGAGGVGTQVDSPPQNALAAPTSPVFPSLVQISFQSRTSVDVAALKLILDRAPSLSSISYTSESKGLHNSIVQTFALCQGRDTFCVDNVGDLRRVLNRRQ